MTLQDLQQAFNHASSALHALNFSAFSFALVVVGLGILVAFLIVGLGYLTVRAFTSVPSMTTKQFLALMVFLGAFLLLVGVLLP
jgi:hypothetical protein